jgi:hypothetical protein
VEVGFAGLGAAIELADLEFVSAVAARLAERGD